MDDRRLNIDLQELMSEVNQQESTDDVAAELVAAFQRLDKDAQEQVARHRGQGDNANAEWSELMRKVAAASIDHIEKHTNKKWSVAVADDGINAAGEGMSPGEAVVMASEVLAVAGVDLQYRMDEARAQGHKEGGQEVVAGIVALLTTRRDTYEADADHAHDANDRVGVARAQGASSAIRAAIKSINAGAWTEADDER